MEEIVRVSTWPTNARPTLSLHLTFNPSNVIDPSTRGEYVWRMLKHISGVLCQPQAIPDTVHFPETEGGVGLTVPAIPQDSYREWFTATSEGGEPFNQSHLILEDPDVFIADVAFASNLNNLAELGVRHVLSIAPFKEECFLETPDGWVSDKPHLFSDRGINRKIVVFEDSGEAKPHEIQAAYDAFRSLYSEAQQSGGAVLIHCKAGCSRSPLILAAFIAKHQRSSLREAVQHISQFRNVSLHEDRSYSVRGDED